MDGRKLSSLSSHALIAFRYGSWAASVPPPDAAELISVCAICATYAYAICASSPCQRPLCQWPNLGKLLVMENEPLDQRIPVMMSKSGVSAIDAYRRNTDGLPSRAEAIRRLIELGLEAAKRDSSEP